MVFFLKLILKILNAYSYFLLQTCMAISWVKKCKIWSEPSSPYLACVNNDDIDMQAVPSYFTNMLKVPKSHYLALEYKCK